MLDAAAVLKWYAEQGLDETIGEDAVDRFALKPSAPAVVAGAAVQIGRAHV